ncbi:MAG: peptidyl-alpha-hydroxyglycine alpha-amidating lyase family protein, partial [Bythopirellula sp.]
MTRFIVQIAGCLLVIFFAGKDQATMAQQPTVEAQVPQPYPRVNPAPWYEVDSSWPEKPDEYEWAAVPGIAVDQQDRIWIFTRSNPPVQVYSADGKLIRAWGEDVIETAHHLKIDHEGAIWVADIGKHVVLKFNPQGEVLMTIGTSGVAGEDETHLNKPTDMAIAPNGHVFVSDGYRNNRVVHFDANGKFVKQWGTLGTGPEEFSLPHAIAIDSTGKLYVADRNNARVVVYNQSGELVDRWEDLVVPWGFWVTSSDDIWVCGSSPMRWRRDPKYPDAPLG